MFVKLCRLFIYLLFIFYQSAITAYAINKSQLIKQLEDIITTDNHYLNIGISVITADTGEVLYAKNENNLFMPASNQKLFTAFAALSYLKDNFRYQTYLFADLGKLKNNVLYDNIYFKFTGDPTLSTPQLDNLVTSLQKANIHEIQGDIIIDDSAFDGEVMSNGSTWDDRYYCYGAPINTIILNHNCVYANMIPGKTINNKATLELPSYAQSMSFTNEVMTLADNSTPCSLITTLTSSHQFTVTGCIKNNEQPKMIKMAVFDARDNVKFTLVNLLKVHGITFNKNIIFSTIDHPVKYLNHVDSPSLADMVTTMLKESDNTIANALFKTMGSYATKTSGSWHNGQLTMQYLIKQYANIDLAKRSLFDGAGGSRYNFLTTRQIVMLLQKAQSAPFAAIFHNALPISGVDGTLKDRMLTPVLTHRVHAKTGSMSAVSSLSGYLYTQHQKRLIFSILINGFTESPNEIKALEDKLCAAMLAI